MGKGKRNRAIRQLHSSDDMVVLLSFIGAVAVSYGTFESALQISACNLESVSTNLDRVRDPSQQKDVKKVDRTLAEAEELSLRHPHIPMFRSFLDLCESYKEMRGIRNRLAHGSLMRRTDGSYSLTSPRYPDDKDVSVLVGEVVSASVRLVSLIEEAYELAEVVSGLSREAVESLIAQRMVIRTQPSVFGDDSL